MTSEGQGTGDADRHRAKMDRRKEALNSEVAAKRIGEKVMLVVHSGQRNE